MAMIPIPSDFSEFLRLLNENDVKYLLIGGYAVGYHGYVRATGDMDIWYKRDRENAGLLIKVLKKFGFDQVSMSVDMFTEPDNIVRMGVPPVRIELINTISGVTFEECYTERITDSLNGIPINIISLEKLKKNKKAAGRLKDLSDLEHLE